jgi:hypothetical protein
MYEYVQFTAFAYRFLCNRGPVPSWLNSIHLSVIQHGYETHILTAPESTPHSRCWDLAWLDLMEQNDDGPPSSSSPNIFGFSRLLRERLGWDVRVVVPDCQKSWVGKAYAISDIINATYFYPRGKSINPCDPVPAEKKLIL